MNRDRAEQILKDSNALLTGHFILASGKHSGQYMQCARVLQFPDYAEEFSRELADAFKQDAVDVVIGPATGGIILAYELSRQLGAKNMFAERADGKMALRRGFELQPGQRVLVSEDVITTGGSVLEVMELVRGLGGNVVGVAVLVDRSMGKADFGVKTVSGYTAEIVAYDPSECPLCKEGKIPAEKPGSRGLKPR